MIVGRWVSMGRAMILVSGPKSFGYGNFRVGKGLIKGTEHNRYLAKSSKSCHPPVKRRVFFVPSSVDSLNWGRLSRLKLYARDHAREFTTSPMDYPGLLFSLSSAVSCASRA